MEKLQQVPRRRLIAAISVLGGLSLSTAAHAQSAEAEALFNDGDALMKQGKTAEACEAFEASNRLENRAGTLIRLGECREKNRQLASAWSAYKDALTRVKDPKKKAIATAQVAALEARLSYLTVSVPDDSRVDGLALTRNGQALDPALWNRAVPVNGGEYVIGGRAPGHEEWTTTVTVPVASGKISVEVPRFKELRKLPPPPPDRPLVTAPGEVAVEPGRDDAGGMWTTRRKIALGVGGGAAISVAAGIVFGVQARSKQDEADELCPEPGRECGGAVRAEALNDAAQRRALVANIAFGVAGAAAITAGVLWFTGAPERAHVAIAPSIAPGAAAVTVVGRF